MLITNDSFLVRDQFRINKWKIVIKKALDIPIQNLSSKKTPKKPRKTPQTKKKTTQPLKTLLVCVAYQAHYIYMS